MKTYKKIGIIVSKEINSLRNWELILIMNLVNSNNCEVTIIDIRNVLEDNKSKKKTFFKNSIVFFIYGIQEKIEKILFGKSNNNKLLEQLKDRLDIILCLKNVELNGKLNLNEESYKKIKEANLEIIIDLQGLEFNSKDYDCTEQGFLQIFFSNNNKADYPYALKEIAKKEEYCIISLMQYNSEYPNGIIIDTAYHNWFWGFYRTQLELQQKGIALIQKNLTELNKKNRKYEVNLIEDNNDYQLTNVTLLKYLFNFYKNILKYKMHNTFPLGRLDCWTLNIGEGEFIQADLSKITSIDMPKDVFWADPFLYKYNNKHFVFFENLPYKNMVGKISVGEIKKMKNGNFSLENVNDIFTKDYHLSYPCIFNEDNEIFMIPETGGNKRLEIYKCVQFPDKWELFSTAFEGEKIADATYFKDKNNQKWLFLNKGVDLYIYQIDSLKLEKIDSHRQNPVSMDCRKSRNAGPIFQQNDSYVRPNQVNTFGIYGRALRLSKIINLDLNNYEEEELTVVEPDFRKNVIGIHHLHQLENMFVFDSCYKKY
ncbi:glucosamine inositolphosphorylceramide transferase family protein [Flavobacterium psychrolimnae]|uniref:Glucosamine inositolphosphorylceramide transferase 1 N-terminal domain-containing protein n=1 Tax=Flavobacterium psychrolimnae TaxID=249351 RepID=A0A366AYL8_9FLAO|nr:hypothetical protein [Flavobacterium psychrolimnae]RBN49503.1 hypothetical protein DR980_12485 [Flavobacterium psychrolimnae]